MKEIRTCLQITWYLPIHVRKFTKIRPVRVAVIRENRPDKADIHFCHAKTTENNQIHRLGIQHLMSDDTKKKKNNTESQQIVKRAKSKINVPTAS